ncbi:MAG: AAA family ATPase, partial [Nanoarchaeota archaeon]|nr:AAA family ATPase [Nanoarchaeota archaeon]
MKIRRIKLHNIRSHVDTEVELKEGISVFTGRTGSGKSSILLAIEYGLFGSDAGVSNSLILRRGKPSGYIELEFEEGGDVYTIRRGLKRKGKTISLDVSNMGIFKNGKPISIVGRASDLNTIILNILNYPKDVKPKEIFEITSYTKQDEIRSLIELSPEKRQEYIDKILQLSKYKTTWENMKEVISYFELNLQEIKGRLENMETLKKEKEELEAKISSLKEILKSVNSKLEELRKKYLVVSKEVKELETKRNEILEKRRDYDKMKGGILRLKEENKMLENEIKKLEKEKEDLLPKIKTEELNYEELKEKEINLRNLISLNKDKIRKTEEEIKKLTTLGVGECPVCKQPITKEHLNNVNKEFKKQKEEIEKEIQK